MKDASEFDPSRLIASPEDRRTFRRIGLNMLAHVRLSGSPPAPSLCDSASVADEALYEFQAVLASDISMTGLFFSSALSYAVGAAMDVFLCLNKTQFIIPATVARRIRTDNRHFGYGLNFQQHQTSKEFRIALATYLLRHDSAVPAAKAVAAGVTR